ncbi:MAG: HipA N-terminal domain-containing protein, partial [Archangium sp.]|nr:HipA N-terminal domain-containing protein [Archangium sp.]
MSTSVEVHLDLEGRDHVVGRLLDSDRGIHFQYAPAFLDTGLELSPFKLPLAPGVSSVGIPEFHSLPGLFHDSLPDGWGLLLMHRRLRMVGLDPERISVLRWLTHLGARAMGALVFHPLDEGLIASPAELNLKTLETEAQRVF